MQEKAFTNAFTFSLQSVLNNFPGYDMHGAGGLRGKDWFQQWRKVKIKKKKTEKMKKKFSFSLSWHMLSYCGILKNIKGKYVI